MAFPKRSAGLSPTCRAFVVGAAALLVAHGAWAQSLTYGPILGRGNTPDQTLIHWGTGAATDATTVAYRKKGAPDWQSATGDPTKDHEVVLKGLDAGTTYDYEVRSLTGAPEAGGFTTCPMPGLPMDFVFYGDSRSGMAEHVKIAAQVTTKAPEMVFESGDIVVDGTYARYLSEFFPAVKALARSTPFMAAPGNHDAMSNLATNFGLLFPAPRPAGAAWQSYYSFTCGNALFIGLDSNSVSDATQLKFLTDQLQAGKSDATIDHVFVWMHHAAYSVGLHGDNTTVQSQWVPLLNQPGNKVTAVFAGHDHLYARMDDGSGVFYLVSGGAGAGLYGELLPSKAKKVVVKSTYNFVAIHLAGTTVSGIAYDDTGTEIDRFGKGVPLPDGGVPPDLSSGGGDDAGGSGNSDGGTGGDLAVRPPPPAGGCAVVGHGSSSSGSAPLFASVFLLGVFLLRRREPRRAPR